MKKITKPRIWWAKLSVAILLSNILFFMLFSGGTASEPRPTPQGWVELQIQASLLTPFKEQKRILLVQRAHRKSIEGVLLNREPGGETVTVLISELEASAVFHHEGWEILPYMKNLSFPRTRKYSGVSHEIRY